MPLRRLELKDFKSYRGTQVIDFGTSHFTCIIGPNGSGKSNLMDAISFVLGVRSTQLRSGQLKELIYRGRKALEGESGGGEIDGADAGGIAKDAKKKGKKAPVKAKTKKAPPKLGKRKQRDDEEEDEESDLTEEEDDEDEAEKADDDEDASAEEEENESVGAPGANDAKSAWVMAVYEDADGKEWRYKRSINFSGASTYLLNDTAVAALKYTQSLEKHNILVKAKNFLVFQGDVEAVASQSGKALCKLVDQISGSLDLANDYNAAKLANDKANEVAAQNYTKKRGMNTELKQWKEQKDEAKRYLAMTAERKALIVQHLLWRLYHIESSITGAQGEIDTATESLDGLKAEVSSEEKKVLKAKKEQAEANLKLKKQELEVKKASKILDEKRPALLALETKIEHAKKKIATSTAQLKAVEKDEARQAANLAGLQKDKAEAETAAEAAAKAQEAASKKKGISLKPEQLAEYHTLRATANTHAADERKNLETIRRSSKKSKDQLNGLQDKFDLASGKRNTIAGEASALEERVESFKVKIEDLTSERQQVKDELRKLQAERTRVAQLEAETNEKLQEVYNKLLQARVDRRESDREVKLKETLANLKRVFPGVRGRAIDLCKPTLEKYNQAVTVVLGRNIDSVIVDQERTAIECIEYLRNQRAGQATFIPLDTIQVKPFPEKYRNMGKTVRPAIDSISCGDYTRAFQHICGSTLICDTEAEAKEISYKNSQDMKIVTLDGTVFHKSGLITGGQGQGQGKKFDQKEVEALDKKREAFMGKLSELGKSKPKGHDDDALVARIRQFDTTITTAKDDLSRAQLQLDGFRGELKSLDEAIKKMRPEIRKLEKAVADSSREATKLSEAVEAADDAVFADFCAKIGVKSIRDYEDVQVRAAQQASEARMKYDAQIARLVQAIKFDEAQLQSTRNRVKQLQNIIARETTAVDETLEGEKTTLEQEIQDAEADLETQEESLLSERERTQAKGTAVDAARKALSKAVKNYDNVLKLIGAHNDAIEKHGSERFAIYRRCRLEEIALPLARGSLAKVPLEEHAQDEEEMDVDSLRPAEAKDYGISVDFKRLDDEATEDDAPEFGVEKYEKRISTLSMELERLAPNGRVNDRLDEVETRLKAADSEADEAKTQQKKARDEFVAIRKKRCDLFKKAFEHISACIDPVYKELTKGPTAPAGGVAYLSLEDNDEPYLAGIKYHAMPPMKRFRDMEQLSGGEKTMAALALLFAIHSFQPSPFFVLDEVDAALDNSNVGRIASYIRKHCGPAFQFIVISLKGSLYERSNSLVGIYRDQEVNSSQSLTLDLQKYDE